MTSANTKGGRLCFLHTYIDSINSSGLSLVNSAPITVSMEESIQIGWPESHIHLQCYKRTHMIDSLGVTKNKSLPKARRLNCVCAV